MVVPSDHRPNGMRFPAALRVVMSLSASRAPVASTQAWILASKKSTTQMVVPSDHTPVG